MSIQFDMPLAKWEDGILTITLTPPQPIGGWDIRFHAQKRFGEVTSGAVVKSCASGFGGGQSGITIVNSGQGILNIRINEVNTSGWDFGNYAATVQRFNSGRTLLSQGYLVLLPNIG